jgi:superfamily II helicase
MKNERNFRQLVKEGYCRFGDFMFRTIYGNVLFSRAACAIVEENEDVVIARLAKYMGNKFGKVTVRENAMRFPTTYIAKDCSVKVVTPYVKIVFNRFNGFSELEFYATKKGLREVHNIEKALYELSRKVDFYAQNEENTTEGMILAETC